ncbi:MAG: MarR family winged helix-turn-helix transcriptional regulator [Dorea sp.]
MKELSEEILDAWLRLSQSVNNDRVVTDLSYNESLICNILYRAQAKTPDREITATDLCSETKILKSQMNRTLNILEEKELILRERSTSDKRRVLIRLNPAHLKTYEIQHQKILNLIDAIISEIGDEKSVQAMDLFHTIADIAGKVLES